MASNLGITPYHVRRKPLANSAVAKKSQTVPKPKPTTNSAVFFIHDSDQSPIVPDNNFSTNNRNNEIPPSTSIKGLPTISSVPANKSIL
jgi:hypothetical protein